MIVIELFAGIGGFRYGLEEANQSSRECGTRTRSPECPRPIGDSSNCAGDARQGDKDTCGNRQQQKEAKTQGEEVGFSNQVQQSDQPEKWGNNPGIRCLQQGSKEGQRGKDTKKQRGVFNSGKFDCVWANEWDKYACQIYRKHWGEVCEQDIRAVDPSTIPEHDLITAGFPCQSFSIAGKRGGFEDTRGTLFFEICRIARAKRTPYLLLENVKGLLSHDDGDTFQTILRTLDELGYDCQWQVLNSKNFGVPQNRERVFIIGHLRGQPRPKVFPIGETDQAYSESGERGSQEAPAGYGLQSRDGHPESTSRNARLNPAPDEDISTAIDANYHKGCLDHGQRTMIFKRGIMGEKNKKWLEDGKENSRNFPQGQRVYDPAGISAQINAQGGGWGGKTGLYEIAQALQTDGQLRQGVSWGTDKPQSARNIRRLTPIECERLQGFPDNWTEGVSDTQRYKMLGNAITTNVVTAIGIQWLTNDTQV